MVWRLRWRRHPTRRSEPSSSRGQAVASAPDRTSASSSRSPEASRDALEQTYHPNVRAIRALEKPVLGAINGPVAGAGLSLACACDVRVGSSNATFVPGFIGIGLIPDAGSTWFVHRLLGFTRAFEWMVSNRRLSADEALDWGLVSEVVPAEGFETRVAELAEWYAALPTRAVAMTKQLFEHAYTGVARPAAPARGGAPAGGDPDRGLRGGRPGVPREAAGRRSKAASEIVEIRTADYHTAGEPFRIVTDGVEPLRGATILDKRRDALDRARPRAPAARSRAARACGHVRLLPRRAGRAGADLGVVFFHNAGYSTACGHGTIALVTWALEEGVRRAARRERTMSSSTCPRVGSMRGRRWRTAAFARCASGTSPRSSGRTGLEIGERTRRRRLRRRVLRVAWRNVSSRPSFHDSSSSGVS